MKINSILIMAILAIAILPLISADVIMPGYHNLEIKNYITNLNEFPDYVFISGANKGFGPGTGMCPFEVIEEGENIGVSYYKYCSISIYAVPKDKFNLEKMNEINGNDNASEVEQFLIDLEAKEVLKDIEHYEQIPDTSTENSKTNYYEIDKNLLIKSEPSKTDIERNNLIYYYIIIPAVALIIIISIILVKRRK